MTVEHTTLLQYLGKHIKYQLSVHESFDSSGFISESGVVISVNIELSGDHQLCLKIDGYAYDEFVSLSEMRNISILEDAECIRTDIN